MKSNPVSESPVVVRAARASDVLAIVRLVNAGGPQGKPREALPDPLPAGYWEAFARIENDPNSRLMVAEQAGTVVGTFHLHFLVFLTGKGRPEALIESVHVAEEQRGQGIGQLMMQWAIDESRRHGCHRLQLATDKRRTGAHRFYQRLGFVASHEGMKLYLTEN